jgi:hypothetical protein
VYYPNVQLAVLLGDPKYLRPFVHNPKENHHLVDSLHAKVVARGWPKPSSIGWSRP